MTRKFSFAVSLMLLFCVCFIPQTTFAGDKDVVFEQPCSTIAHSVVGESEAFLFNLPCEFDFRLNTVVELKQSLPLFYVGVTVESVNCQIPQHATYRLYGANSHNITSAKKSKIGVATALHSKNPFWHGDVGWQINHRLASNAKMNKNA